MHTSLRAPRLSAITLFSLLLTGLSATAQEAVDQAALPFNQGSILIICGERVTGETITSEDFFAGFPDWVALLQQQADAGIVTRAFYLDTLKEGVFIVVGGTSRETAQDEADDLIAAMADIYTNATGREIDPLCQTYSIGPLAVQPR